MKTIVLFRKRPGLNRDEFREYYERKHVPLAVHYIQFSKYVRNYVIAPTEVDYDVLSEFWLADPAAASALATSPAGTILRADEARFMTEDRYRATAEESLLAGPPRDIQIGRVPKYALMLSRGAYAAEADFIADTIDWGRRLANDPELMRVTMDIVKPFAGGTFPADAILWFWPTDLFDVGRLATKPHSTEFAEILTLDAYETPLGTLTVVH